MDIVREIATLAPDEVYTYLDELPAEKLDQLSAHPEVPLDIRSLIVLNHFNPENSLNLLENLGHELTKAVLFRGKVNDRLKAIFDQLFAHHLVQIQKGIDYTIISTGRNGSEIQTIAKILSILQMNLEEPGKKSQFNDLLQFYTSVVSCISDPKFIVEQYHSLYLKDHRILRPLQKQAVLIYSQYFTENDPMNFYTAFSHRNFPVDDLTLVALSSIEFRVLHNMLTLKLIPNLHHQIVSEIDDKEQLVLLFGVDAMNNVRDKILRKLDFDAMIRIIQDHSKWEIVDLIGDKDLLHRIFYETDIIEVKAKIAKKLKSDKLSFEVLQQLFENENEIYLSQIEIRNLFVLLQLKQLALLRLSLPSEYHQLLHQMVREKEKQEQNDRSFFS